MYLASLQVIRKMFGKHSEDENIYISTKHIAKNKKDSSYICHIIHIEDNMLEKIIVQWLLFYCSVTVIGNLTESTVYHICSNFLNVVTDIIFLRFSYTGTGNFIWSIPIVIVKTTHPIITTSALAK